MMAGRRHTRTTVGLALALAMGAAAPPVRAAPASDDAAYVRDVVSQAAAHVEAGRYERALEVLDQAERERPLPVFVYVRATIEERRGDCGRAVALYRRFLALPVAEEDAEEARRGVARCEGEPSPVPPPVGPVPVEPPRDDGASPSPSPAPPPPRPWYADPLGDALVAVGLVGVGVGAGLLGRSRVEARAAEGADALQAYDERSRRATALDRAGLVTLAVGSALLVGGVVRLVVVGTRPRRSRTTAALDGLRIRF